MFAYLRLIAILTAAVLSIAGCQEKQQSRSGREAKVLAKVNGTPIEAADLTFQPRKAHGDEPKVNRSLEDVINQELLYQQGIKLGLDKDPSYRADLPKLERQPAEARRIEMARRVLNTQIASKIDIKFSDAKDYYEKNADRIATRLHLQMIKFDDKQKAEEALKKIRSGTAFEAVAPIVMGDAPVQGRKPWDLGFVKWDQIPVDFFDAIHRLKPGEVSDVLGTRQAGFQIVKLIESKKGPKLEFSAIQASVMNRLRDLRLLEAYYQYVAQLKKDAKIEIF